MPRNRARADRPLSFRAQRFLELYLNDPNATKAAIGAGYSAKTAAQLGQRLLKDARVAKAIAAGQKARLARARVKGDRIVQELETLALVDIGDIIDFTAEVPMLKAANTIPENARRAITSVKVRRTIVPGGVPPRAVEIIEFKLSDKNTALTTLMRHHGLLIDKIKIEDDLSEEELERRVLTALRTAAARKKAGAKPE